jgi:hypothetical protein
MPDRNEVIKGLEYCEEYFNCCYKCPYWDSGIHCTSDLAHDALTLLKEQEVKIGYWIDIAGNNKCSICGEEYSDLYPDYGDTHFCPNCGAKMKGR